MHCHGLVDGLVDLNITLQVRLGNGILEHLNIAQRLQFVCQRNGLLGRSEALIRINGHLELQAAHLQNRPQAVHHRLFDLALDLDAFESSFERSLHRPFAVFGRL